MLLVYVYLYSKTNLPDRCFFFTRIIVCVIESSIFLPPRCPSLFFLSFVPVYYAPDTSRGFATSDTIG